MCFVGPTIDVEAFPTYTVAPRDDIVTSRMPSVAEPGNIVPRRTAFEVTRMSIADRSDDAARRQIDVEAMRVHSVLQSIDSATLTTKRAVPHGSPYKLY